MGGDRCYIFSLWFFTQRLVVGYGEGLQSTVEAQLFPVQCFLSLAPAHTALHPRAVLSGKLRGTGDALTPVIKVGLETVFNVQRATATTTVGPVLVRDAGGYKEPLEDALIVVESDLFWSLVFIFFALSTPPRLPRGKHSHCWSSFEKRRIVCLCTGVCVCVGGESLTLDLACVETHVGTAELLRCCCWCRRAMKDWSGSVWNLSGVASLVRLLFHFNDWFAGSQPRVKSGGPHILFLRCQRRRARTTVCWWRSTASACRSPWRR